jgi:hypothetical protein
MHPLLARVRPTNAGTMIDLLVLEQTCRELQESTRRQVDVPDLQMLGMAAILDVISQNKDMGWTVCSATNVMMRSCRSYVSIRERTR